MRCEIEWNTLPLAEWNERFSRIRRANLLQSYDYARAACSLYHQKARWGLITIDGREAGLVQLLEAGIGGNILHAVMLDRGPLWFDGRGGSDDQQAFFAAINRQFPRRFGRRRRIIPETQAFDHPGYKRLPRPGYQTIWLDLTQDEDRLRAALGKKWRNALRKTESGKLSVTWDDTGEFWPFLLTNYQSDKAKKGYDGPSVRLLQNLAKVFIPEDRFLIARAMLDNRAIAAILVLCHGCSATYQIGWSSDEGRHAAAHNLLLWQAVCHLKEKGFKDFDLGGVNDDTAKGVKRFKEGMGGQRVVCAGHFI